jgi:hypothetical protein
MDFVHSDCVLGGALFFVCQHYGFWHQAHRFDRIDRRTHYIVATSLALGVGTRWSLLGPLLAGSGKPTESVVAL